MKVGRALSISLTRQPDAYPKVRLAGLEEARKVSSAIPIHSGQGSELSAAVLATFSLEPVTTR